MATLWDPIAVLNFPPFVAGEQLTCRGRAKSKRSQPLCLNPVDKVYRGLAYATIKKLSALSIEDSEIGLDRNPDLQELLSNLAEYSLCKHRHRKSGTHPQHEEVIESWHISIEHHRSILTTTTETNYAQRTATETGPVPTHSASNRHFSPLPARELTDMPSVPSGDFISNFSRAPEWSQRDHLMRSEWRRPQQANLPEKTNESIVVVSTQLQDTYEPPSMIPETRITLPDPPQTIMRKPVALATPPETPERDAGRAIRIEESSTPVYKIKQTETPPDTQERKLVRSGVLDSSPVPLQDILQLPTPPMTPPRHNKDIEFVKTDVDYDNDNDTIQMSSTSGSANPLLSRKRQLDTPDTPTRPSRYPVSQVMQPQQASMMDYTTERYEDGSLAERNLPYDRPENKRCFSVHKLWQACRSCFSFSS